MMLTQEPFERSLTQERFNPQIDAGTGDSWLAGGQNGA